MVRMRCACTGVQARTRVRPNVRNTITVSGQEESLPEFYFPEESSGTYLCLCMHTYECALSLSRCCARSPPRSCLHTRGNLAFHPYICAPMPAHHAHFPSSFLVSVPTQFSVHAPRCICHLPPCCLLGRKFPWETGVAQQQRRGAQGITAAEEREKRPLVWAHACDHGIVSVESVCSRRHQLVIHSAGSNMSLHFNMSVER